MLIEFSVENFRSIKEKVTFSMVSVKDDSLNENIIETSILKNDSLLKSAAIYGANASGKSNIILALKLLKGFVLLSHTHQKGNKLNFFPFKLDKQNLLKPTKFNITFIEKNIQYVYGFSFNSEKIINEYLYQYPNKKIIFERTNTNKCRFPKDETKQKLIFERTLPNMLYLSKATQENYLPVSNAFDWFNNRLQVISSTNHSVVLQNYTAGLLKDESAKKLILKALCIADLEIDGISVTVETKKEEDFPRNMPSEFKKLMMHNKKSIEEITINTTHKSVSFDFSEESEGTQRMFFLIGLWIDSLKNGRVLIVDELDIKLHHLLNVFLINLFHNPTQNKKNAQLVFTTHNTNLLDTQNIFRRDQIWFTEKNPKTGATDLYSLAEYSPRKDKNIEKGYLAGKYGALPFIKNGKVF